MVGFGSHSSVAEHWHLKPGILGLIHNSDLLLTLFILPHNIKDPTIEYPLCRHTFISSMQRPWNGQLAK